MTATETTYCRNDDVAWRIIDGAAVIVTPRDGMVHQLNETGTFIWQHLETPASASALASAMCEDYDIDEKTALEHILEFLQILTAKTIVKESER